MTLIKLDGRIVAVHSPRRLHFTCEPDPRLRRFVLAMGVYAREVATGHLDGPYSDELAERYARAFLMDDLEFTVHASDTDAQLAERFEVPLEQIAQKRVDLLYRQPAPGAA